MLRIFATQPDLVPWIHAGVFRPVLPSPSTSSSEPDLLTRLDVDTHPLVRACIDWCRAWCTDDHPQQPPPPPRFDPDVPPLAWPGPAGDHVYHLGAFDPDDVWRRLLAHGGAAARVLSQWAAEHRSDPAAALDCQRNDGWARRLAQPLESLRVALLQRPRSATAHHPLLLPHRPETDDPAPVAEWIPFDDLAVALGWQPPLRRAYQWIPLLAHALRPERPHWTWRLPGPGATVRYHYRWTECCGDLRRAASLVAALPPDWVADPQLLLRLHHHAAIEAAPR